jgi:hypothetical protein
MKGQRTLQIVLQSMIGMEVSIELKTDLILEGFIEEVGQGMEYVLL